MSIQSKIDRITGDRDTIRNKLVGMGLAESTDNLTELAEVITGITDNEGYNITVVEGQSVTIPKGYHDGTGIVKGVAGGGNYKLQSKTVTPAATQQTVTPSGDYYGLERVLVKGIPAPYYDVSNVDAAAGDVLTGKTIVAADGTEVAGTMPNNGAVNRTMDGVGTTSVSIPAGYTSGGSVELDDTIPNAVSAAKTALADKGVEVPDGTDVTGLAGLIESIESGGGGDTSVEDGIIERTIAGEYSNNRVTTIGQNAFFRCDSMTSVNFPLVTSIGSSAFYGCGSLKSANFPAATTIEEDAFIYCASMTSVNFPVAISIGEGAFYQCMKLTSANFPAVTTIGKDAFRYCTTMTSVNFPAAASISSSAFRDCSSLTTVVLGASSVCTLRGSNAFSGTPMSTTGWFYVPASLLTAYQAATNWTFFSSRFSAKENMPTS